MAMRAVIFDFGGVLACGMGRHLDSWERRLGLTPGMLPATIWGSALSERAARGYASQEEVWAGMGATFGLDAVALAELQRDFFADETLDEQLLSFVQGLRPRYKTAILSNAWPGARATFEDRHRLNAAMDELIISAEEGLAKPDPRLYQLAAGRLASIRESASSWTTSCLAYGALRRSVCMACISQIRQAPSRPSVRHWQQRNELCRNSLNFRHLADVRGRQSQSTWF